ncbi:unnamed protein product, partial [Rotaria sp. Silwood1]
LPEINLNAKLILPPCPIRTSSEDWADDEGQIEGDDDDLNRENLNSNQDEQDDG